MDTRLLKTYLKASVVLGTGFILFFAYFEAWLNFLGPSGFLALIGLSAILLKTGRATAGARVLSLALWLAPSWCALVSGGLHSPLLIWFTPHIFMTAALLGWRWSLRSGAASVLTTALILPFPELWNALNEFPAGQALELLTALSAASAVAMITLYGVLFSRAAQQAEQGALAGKDAAEAGAAAKGSFLAAMSHEIRTPMNGVSGMAHLLSKTELTDEQRQYLDALVTSSAALLTLIDDVLDYSKIEAGKLDLDIAPFALREMIEGVDELMSIKAEQKGIRFAAIVDRDVPDDHQGDPGRLRQILVNLTNNAVKFTENGNVILRVRLKPGSPPPSQEHGSELALSITDTGIGMSREVLDKLFSPFTQADASTTRKFGGTGLGLSISKELCELMGSQIQVESEPRLGSTFSFDLHLKSTSGPPPTPPLLGTTVALLAAPEPCREVLEEGLAYLGANTRLTDELSDLAHACTQINIQAPHEPTTIRAVIYQPSLASSAKKGAVATAVGTILATPGLANIPLIVALPIQLLHQAAELSALGARAVLSEPVRLSRLRHALLSPLDASAISHPPLDTQDAPALTGHVLLVDDNQINRVIASRLLTKLGLKVTVAENGQAALELAIGRTFDVILMDCQMPIMDGYETTRTLRALGGKHSTQNLPIIALTAGAMKSDRDACTAAGMNDYIAKPIVPAHLHAVLSTHLCKPSDCSPKGSAEN